MRHPVKQGYQSLMTHIALTEGPTYGKDMYVTAVSFKLPHIRREPLFVSRQDAYCFATKTPRKAEVLCADISATQDSLHTFHAAT
jgi:hypothetical protein